MALGTIAGRKRLLVLICLCAAAARATADLGGTLDVRTLVSASDAVVVGRVDAVSGGEAAVVDYNGNPRPGRMTTVTVHVDTVLKGDVGVTLSCRIAELQGSPDPSPVRNGAYLMLFLRIGASGCSFTDVRHHVFPAVAINTPADPDPLDRVAVALMAVVTASSTSPYLKGEAIDQLGRFRTARAHELLLQALKSKEDVARRASASALMYAGDLSGLGIVEQTLLAAGDVSDGDRVRARLAMTRVSDPAAVPALSLLLASPARETRQVAADALRRTKSPLAVQPLLRALNDQEPEVQYAAVMGLYAIVNNSNGAPSFELFRRDPIPFVGHWKEWAARQTAPKR